MTFDLLTSSLILLAGMGAGAINAVVGSGTLITFPALVAFGVPPQAATMSNALGLISGNVASSLGYREEIRGHGKRLLKWIPASMIGSLIGAILLILLPEKSFELIVPVLIVFALIMVIVQPRVQRFLRERKTNQKHHAEQAATGASTGTVVALYASLFFTAIYGGYFAAAQGIILIGLLGVILDEPLQRINGFKNVLTLFVNVVSAATYAIVGFSKIVWMAVLLIAVGSLIGGYIGARLGRKLNPLVLRGIIVLLGIVALVRIIGLHT